MSLALQEYFVAGFIQGREFHVVGRNGDSPIEVGDTFDAIYRYEYRTSPDGLSVDAIRFAEKKASIRVVGIFAFNRDLNLLGQAMTCRLTLEGEGIEHIGPGWVLGHRSSLASSQNGSASAVSEDVVRV